MGLENDENLRRLIAPLKGLPRRVHPDRQRHIDGSKVGTRPFFPGEDMEPAKLPIPLNPQKRVAKRSLPLP